MENTEREENAMKTMITHVINATAELGLIKTFDPLDAEGIRDILSRVIPSGGFFRIKDKVSRAIFLATFFPVGQENEDAQVNLRSVVRISELCIYSKFKTKKPATYGIVWVYDDNLEDEKTKKEAQEAVNLLGEFIEKICSPNVNIFTLHKN